jgi:hypothetical protein
MVSDNERLDQGASGSVGANEPVTGTTLSGAAGAHALICLLAEVSVDPTRAALSSLCAGAPSTVDSTGGVDAANAPAGATISTDAALRAAICLLALVASPLPDDIDAAGLARTSSSTLCGAGPSTANGGGDLAVTSERTGTAVDAAPVVAAAICIIMNGTTGDPTIVELSSVCASPIAGTPSTLDTSAPVALTDTTTGTDGDLAPAANAAICVLLDALAQVPASTSDAAARIDLSTSCGSAGGGTTPTDLGATAPATVTPGGAGVDVGPAVAAAVCILASAQASADGTDLALTDACAGTAAMPETPAAGPASSTTAGPETPTTVAGVMTAPAGAGAAIHLQPAGSDMAAGGGQADMRGQAGVPAAGLAGLPSSSTGAIGGALAIACLATMAALGRRRSTR